MGQPELLPLPRCPSVWELLTAEKRAEVRAYFGLPPDWEPPLASAPPCRPVEDLDTLNRIMRERPRPGRAGQEDD